MISAFRPGILTLKALLGFAFGAAPAAVQSAAPNALLNALIPAAEARGKAPPYAASELSLCDCLCKNADATMSVPSCARSACG